jgi:hypothetical protein
LRNRAAPPSRGALEAVEDEWHVSDPALAALILRRRDKMHHASRAGNNSKAQGAALERAARAGVNSLDGVVDRGTFGAPASSSSSPARAQAVAAGAGAGAGAGSSSSSFVARMRGAVGAGAGGKTRFGSVQDNLPDDLRPARR